MKQSWSLVLLKEVLQKLIRNGYQYVKQKDLPNGLTLWECIERRKGNCKAKVKLNAIDDFVGQVQEHTPTPSATRCELTKVRVTIKRKASNTHDTTQQILGTELANLTQTAALNLPNLSNLKRNIRRQRQEQNILPNPPRKEDVPVLPHEYQMIGTGEIFLLFDSGLGDINRMFMFATNDGTDMLASCSQWFGDGALKLCSQIFSQIYAIHALVSHEFLPCMFALFPSKAEIVYEQFFTTVCNAVRNNNGNDPDGFLVDFETAAINAIQNLSPQTDISSCFFHLSSNLWKHIQRAGLQEL